MSRIDLAKSCVSAAAVALVANGCAVLTVDVDVYKGSLANHEDVQTEQLVSMATGAKPLLIQLRDHLEWGQNTPQPTYEHGAESLVAHQAGNMQKRLCDVRLDRRYTAGFMPRRQYRFCNEAADSVNAILSLYEERSGSELAALIEEGEVALNDYRQNYDVIGLTTPEQQKSEEKFWNRLAKGFRNSDTNTFPSVTKDGLTKLTETIEHLRNAYHAYFVPKAGSYRDSSSLFRIPRSIPDSLSSPERTPPSTTNERFWELAHSRILEDHADMLFRKEAPEREQFIQHARNLANAFLQSRDALHRVLRLALTSLTYTDRGIGPPGNSSPQLKTAISTLVTNLVQPSYVTNALNTLSGNSPIRRALAGANIETNTASRDIRHFLFQLLMTNSAPGSLALMQLDDAASKEKGDLMFGLVGGPVYSDEHVVPKDVVQMLGAISVLVAGGLERGRLDIGLETMIENYLKAAYDDTNPKESSRVRRERERLLDALVNFAQKVLFLSNYRTLLENGDAPQLREYLLVLQAVGNSILVQSDELRQQGAYKARQERRRDDTVAAVANAGFTNTNIFTSATDTKSVIAELTTALRLEYLRELTNAATTVATNKITTTSTNVVITTNSVNDSITNVATTVSETVTRSATSRANSLVAAIEAATVLRGDEIYLRPASAFLRNSYPATSLQNNTPLEWRNMLAEHAWHQVPLFGGLTSSENQRNANAVRDIDKQFWQNINRVKLAGAGSVNHVIAKDDVGNWYVKQFSAQTTNIVNSALNLGKFAAGPALGGNLPIRKTDGSSIFGAGTNGAAGSSILERQFGSSITDYTNASVRLYYELTETATNFNQRLATDWRASFSSTNTTSNLAVWENAATNALSMIREEVARAEARTKDRDFASDTQNLLKTVKRYSHAVANAIGERWLTDDKRGDAREVMQATIREVLKDFIRRRQVIIDRYESSLNLIGGVASQ